MMKTTALICAAALTLLSLPPTACGANTHMPGRKAVTSALEKYLAAHGDLCLAKYDWPIEVTSRDADAGSRDALQMPVLEKMGLVAASAGSATRKNDDGEEITLPVTRYALTDAGRRYYIERKSAPARNDSAGGTIAHRGDFCAGRIHLDRIVDWGHGANDKGAADVTVGYTYTFAAADWVRDPRVREVFPMLAQLLEGQHSARLEQHFRQSGGRLTAVNPWED